jgi:hypothetical protein
MDFQIVVPIPSQLVPALAAILTGLLLYRRVGTVLSWIKG